MRKINLLPKERKENLAIENFNKFLLKSGLVVIFAIILFVFFLIANLFILNIYKKINKTEVVRNNENEVSFVIQKAKKNIDDRHTKTSKLVKDIKNKEPFWEYLDKINSIVPEDVYYSKIVMNKDSIRLEGLALDRNSLIEFGDVLEEEDFFSEVDMPISNLTSQENINFEIDINLNEKKTNKISK